MSKTNPTLSILAPRSSLLRLPIVISRPPSRVCLNGHESKMDYCPKYPNLKAIRLSVNPLILGASYKLKLL